MGEAMEHRQQMKAQSTKVITLGISDQDANHATQEAIEPTKAKERSDQLTNSRIGPIAFHVSANKSTTLGD